MDRLKDVYATLKADLSPEDYRQIEWFPSAIASAAGSHGDGPYVFPTVPEPFAEARRGGLPQYYRFDAEQLVGGYLSQPVRHRLIDRHLVRLLIETELFAYAASQLAPNPLNPQPLRQMGALATFAFVTVSGLVGLVALGGVLFALDRWTPLGGAWMGWVFGLAALWTVGATLWNLAFVPRNFMRVRAVRKSIGELFAAMADARLAVISQGPLSVARVSETVRRAADKGTVWPQSIFALLDDIAARSPTM